MQRAHGAAGLVALTVALTGGLVGCDPGPEVCRDVRSGVTCTKLSGFGLFRGNGATQEPADDVVPFEPNSALFSDYTLKGRFLYLPPGQPATYDPTENFALPQGSILAKTFAYPVDATDPQSPRRLLETRLMIHRPEGWIAQPYVWDEAQREATLKPIGTTVDVSWIDATGKTQQNNYVVPNTNQCKECHEDKDRVLHPIGIKARHLNRPYDYENSDRRGLENQLDHLSGLGLLQGAPAGKDAPRLPEWDNPGTGTVAERARAWLEINCAHCHNPDGGARTSGLDLSYSQDLSYHLGMCKPPVAAGRGTGGRYYNIVPGRPDESILIYRIESTLPDIMMPETGRRLPHKEGIALVRQWVSEMPGDCSKPMLP